MMPVISIAHAPLETVARPSCRPITAEPLTRSNEIHPYVVPRFPAASRCRRGDTRVPSVIGATGAVLPLAAGRAARLLRAPVAPPVGVVTTAIGGRRLIWPLSLEVRRRV
jgi:hypothetical protein